MAQNCDRSVKGVAVMRCDVEACGERAREALSHPGRPEPITWLCEYHADRASRWADAAILVDRRPRWSG